ncbi:MAG: transglutaminase domain-containing protein [Nanoarchaeota archaeon]
MSKEKILIKIFEKVQRIPYRVCKFNKDDIDERLRYGDCRHKSHLLFILLKKAGFEVRRIKVLFDWKDLPIPKDIIFILKESSSIWLHDSLKVKINNRWLKVDCTWNPELEKIGFPVTKKWDGKSNTIQVTRGKLRFYEEEDSIKKPKIIKEEAYNFAEKLNELVSV